MDDDAVLVFKEVVKSRFKEVWMEIASSLWTLLKERYRRGGKDIFTHQHRETRREDRDRRGSSS